MLHSYLAHMQD